MVLGKDSTGWMKMGLRAQICSQCRPVASDANPSQLPAAHKCENNCALFVQLPRLARFFERYCAKPPAGYEEFVLKLLCESAAEDPNGDPGALSVPFQDYVHEALAILECVAKLLGESADSTQEHDCARRSFTLGQVALHISKEAADKPLPE
jgi:hypothetical protein